MPLDRAYITELLSWDSGSFYTVWEEKPLWLVKSHILLIVRFSVVADLKKVAEIRQQIPILSQKRSDLYAVEAKKP